jgi:hypothetical protein
MKGLEIARAYYETYGAPMLKARFPQLLPHVAAGLFGSGSECFGYDDDVSRDHDFEPGFMLLLPGEDAVSRRDAFLLERAYAGLPREFMGLRRGLMQPVGGPRRGVVRAADFFRDRTGAEDGILTLGQWLAVPEQSLAEAVNIIGRYGYNMRSLHSRPLKTLMWNYYFYVEGEGDVRSENGRAMMAELGGVCDRLKLLGTYPAKGV